MTLHNIYRSRLALLTDLYQLTMAYGYFKTGLAQREAVFHLTFRQNPFGGGFAIACGLASVVDWLSHLQFSREELDYLSQLRAADGAPLLDAEFLDYLGNLRLHCDVDAVAEGTVVFAHEPLVRVRGPLLECQILETGLLNLINFPTLVATKAARVCRAAGGGPVLEFGLRRAQGPDGGLTASRAAYIGGCVATSNVLAGQYFEIPVRGTHAHSWIMAFDDEGQAMQTWGEVMPHNCILLVDTYDTLAGVRHAVEVGRRLRRRGVRMLGIRLDSGDLVQLSCAARRMLDEAGLTDARIVASNDLDEYAIERLRQQGARIDIWGVGTRLATAWDQPALGGVYKLAAVRDDDGQWQYRVKRSQQLEKSSMPGILQVRRLMGEDGFMADAIYDQPAGMPEVPQLVALDGRSTFSPREVQGSEDLLIPVFRTGQPVYCPPTAAEARALALAQLQQLPERYQRLHEPEQYPVGVERGLHELKCRLLNQLPSPSS